MQKEEKLEEIRSLRTSNRRKQRVNKERNKEATKEKMLNFRIDLWVRKNQNRNKPTNFAIKAEEKTLS